MENFIDSDCFRRYSTVTVVPSLSIDDNLVTEISEVVCKKIQKLINVGGEYLACGMTSSNKVWIKMMSHQCNYLKLILLIISFQIMLCIKQLLSNKIISSPRYKETVSYLNGELAALFQSGMVATQKYKILIKSHLMTWLWHVKVFASLEFLLLVYCNILMHLKIKKILFRKKPHKIITAHECQIW